MEYDFKLFESSQVISICGVPLTSLKPSKFQKQEPNYCLSQTQSPCRSYTLVEKSSTEADWGRNWSASFYLSVKTSSFISQVKGTVDVISSDTPVIEWHVRFTLQPFKLQSIVQLKSVQLHQHKAYNVTLSPPVP